MDQKCFGLCRHSNEAKVLMQLISDCQPLSEVNSCGLPFKKSDQSEARISKTNFRSGRKDSIEIQERIKSTIHDGNGGMPEKDGALNGSPNIPSPIVLSSRIRNNASEHEDSVSANLTEKQVANATSCESSSFSIHRPMADIKAAIFLLAATMLLA